MCYIFSCFAWGIDFVQRLVSFFLSCLLAIAICFGLTVAIVTGIAYGYNYSMAEWLTFTRNDITVYMRRGAFSKFIKPQLNPAGNPNPPGPFGRSGLRRVGGNEEELFNGTANDYEDHRPPAESKPLADTWLKTQDTRKYAEILTRYNPNKRAEVQNVQNAQDLVPIQSMQQNQQLLNQQLLNQQQLNQQLLSRQQSIQEPPREQIIPLLSPMQEPPGGYRPSPDTPVISIMPNPMIPTVSWRSGSSEIMMRNFQPIQDHTSRSRHTDMPENLFPAPDKNLDSVSIIGLKDQAKESSEAKQRDDFHKSYVPMRVWGTTARAVIADEPEDVDEDNVVYKPV
uniref:SFRICE_011684 n=1 Tax=Spodoptera frugiperda TaxID=7108 RepID=A0A2H1W429_SPOFR